MKKLLIGLLVIGSLSAQATMLETNGPLDEKLFELEMSEDKTYFETLGDLYENGVRPDITKLVNIAFAGRCFSSQSSYPRNAGILFRQQKHTDVGPIGNNRGPVYEGVAYTNYSLDPSYYDHFSFEQLVKPKTKFVEVKKKATYLELKNGEDGVLRLRFAGKYLIQNSVDFPESGTLGKERIYSRCYYFIQN